MALSNSLIQNDSQNAGKCSTSDETFIIKDIHSHRSQMKIHVTKPGSVLNGKLLCLSQYVWDAPPSWHVDVFANPVAKPSLRMKAFIGFHKVGIIN